MGIANQQTSDNAYAVAYVLNNSVLGIITMLAIEDIVGTPEGNDFHELNRAYVLVLDELEKLYGHNPKLAAIKPEPIWKRFDVLKTSSWEINEYLHDPENDLGQAHNARVEKLSIIAGKEMPDFTPEQKKLLDYADSIRIKYGRLLDVLNKERLAKRQNDWHIPEYTLTYKYGQILINNVLKLKKAHDGSVLDELMLLALKNPDKIFHPELEGKRTISTTLSSAGFTSTLKKLFFPEVGKSRGVLFRPNVTNDTAKTERIDTTELDLRLKELGAATEPVSLT